MEKRRFGAVPRATAPWLVELIRIDGRYFTASALTVESGGGEALRVNDDVRLARIHDELQRLGGGAGRRHAGEDFAQQLRNRAEQRVVHAKQNASALDDVA